MKTRTWIGILAVAMVLCAAASFFLLRSDGPATRAQIISQGKILRTVDLHIDQEFTVSTSDGGYNIITVKDGRIAVTGATCPDHYCMKRGFCDGGSQIVCLPNRLVIEFLSEQEIDAVVG